MPLILGAFAAWLIELVKKVFFDKPLAMMIAIFWAGLVLAYVVAMQFILSALSVKMPSFLSDVFQVLMPVDFGAQVAVIAAIETTAMFYHTLMGATDVFAKS
ncbi:hypothetical protein [Craterilacuibacter sp. RT1T]|uniref:hypothetical protein n=1 Tax=Craterilacuibacter sp. RT1T TaxID=2942211 RepID=UPI0020C037FF|nr:hypothetical protein [Craterilacuibacter sp. RT1T]MCL6263157.1 hypothetical protein [Craterilacuibacter sp. RT1T]